MSAIVLGTTHAGITNAVELTRIFHGVSTANAQEGMSTALRLFGLLDILINMPSSPSLRAYCIHALLRALATKPHEIVAAHEKVQKNDRVAA